MTQSCITQAMVLAAGLGTRLRPITDRMPKPLVPVAGRPMLDYVLDLLAEAGIRTAAINVHHFADQMEAHIARETRIDMRVSDERAALMNSGGGLVKGLRLLDRSAPVLVMNADLFWVGETAGKPSALERLAEIFDPSRMDMLLLCIAPEKTTGHNGKKDFNFGNDGHLTRYREGAPDAVVYAGAFAVHPAFFDDAPSDAFNLNLSFDKAIEAGRLYGTMLDASWITVGTPEAIDAAEATLKAVGAGP